MPSCCSPPIRDGARRARDAQPRGPDRRRSGASPASHRPPRRPWRRPLQPVAAAVDPYVSDRPRDCRGGRGQLVGGAERVAGAVDEQARHVQARECSAHPLRPAWWVQRVRDQRQPEHWGAVDHRSGRCRRCPPPQPASTCAHPSTGRRARARPCPHRPVPPALRRAPARSPGARLGGPAPAGPPAGRGSPPARRPVAPPSRRWPPTQDSARRAGAGEQQDSTWRRHVRRRIRRAC